MNIGHDVNPRRRLEVYKMVSHGRFRSASRPIRAMPTLILPALVAAFVALAGFAGSSLEAASGPAAAPLYTGSGSPYPVRVLTVRVYRPSFTEFACNPDSLAVAEDLDKVRDDSRASRLIDYLGNQSPDSLCDDYLRLSPEELTSIFYVGVSLANLQGANLERRMEDFRAGAGGFSVDGLSMFGGGEDAGLAGPSGPEGKEGKTVNAPPEQNRWGAFITGLGDFTDVGNSGAVQGFNFDTGGVTLGADYRVCPNFGIGVTLGYLNTGGDLANGGRLYVNGGKLGIYATAFKDGLYIDGAVIGGLSGYTTRRSAIQGVASGYTNGTDVSTLVNIGYDWTSGGFSAGPLFSFQYTYVGIDGFSETGSLAPLKLTGQSIDSLRTQLGAKASYTWKIGNIAIIPEARCQWQHEYGNDEYSLFSSFANGAGQGFSVNGPQIGHDSVIVSAGVTVQFSERFATYAFYDGELARTNYQSNSVSAGFRYSF